MTEPLLEPFEPRPPRKPVPILPIIFSLAALAAIAWVGWLAWTICTSSTPASPVREQAGLLGRYDAIERALDDQRRAEQREQTLRALYSEPRPKIDQAPVSQEIITVNPSKSEPANVVITGPATWQRPMKTIDGSYYGQIDPLSGKPRTVYLSDPGKYVVDIGAPTQAIQSPQNSTGGARVHEPPQAAPPTETGPTPDGPSYFDFDRHMQNKQSP